MSGFVVCYGNTDQNEMENMFKSISHRGVYVDGIWSSGEILMAQNYLKADIVNEPNDYQVPVSLPHGEYFRICYDGEIANRNDLSYIYDIGSAFMEERMILQLYERFGTSMFEYLDDAIFSFIIYGNGKLFAARDLLGIKTLFYGWKDKTLYLASELKSITIVTDEVYEFPPGHYMDNSGQLYCYAELPESPPKAIYYDIGNVTEHIKDIIHRSLRNRLDLKHSFASLLSGGIDSSVISYLANELYTEKNGTRARLKTFAVGVGKSSDICNARIMADYLGSEHHELIVDIKRVIKTLPEVIYFLESFDPSLVRSSVSNYFISRYAQEHGVEQLLSGEGGDEVFCGYSYLKNYPIDELFSRQMECIKFLHNNASLRLDRMNQCNSIRVIAPLISGELLSYAMSIPSEYKQKPERGAKIEKWIFRKAFENYLPDSIVWRPKQEFSQGSGSASLMRFYFEEAVSEEQLKEIQRKHPFIRSKEEFCYFKIFTEHFGDGYAVDTVGQWISI